jgi:protoheme IX farnesyltransferase
MKRFNFGDTVSLVLPRSWDFVALAKPELTLLSVLTAVGGAFLGVEEGGSLIVVFWTFLGTLAVGAGAGALNMALEYRFDAMMKRTQNRPVPSGRLSPFEATVFGCTLSVAGTAVLLLLTHWIAAILALATLVTYLFLYTPLKRITPFSTLVGAIPGALPPVIGWAAVRGEIGLTGWALFAILYFWQIPHFLSLSWLYRKDYANAGYRFLTVLDESGVRTRGRILIFSFALIPASILPVYTSTVGVMYFIGAFLASVAFFLFCFATTNPLTNVSARRVFVCSLLFLPVLFLLMAVDKL